MCQFQREAICAILKSVPELGSSIQYPALIKPLADFMTHHSQRQDTITAPTIIRKSFGEICLHWASILLVTTVWISAGLFGLYIIAFYAAEFFRGNMDQWNNILPGLYHRNEQGSTAAIGIHFAMGGIILILGSIQLIDSVRTRYPSVHRWLGRIYVTACIVAGLGGLVFILLTGTIGGLIMDIGFGIYGILMLIAGVQTYRHAVTRRLEEHRAWALRLYALAIGSWLYRMDYGFWYFLTDAVGHNKAFSGPFDRIMAFFFYVPNLLVAEIFIRKQQFKSSEILNFASAFALILMTGFLMLGTYYFTKMYWGPAIIGLIFG